MLPKEERRAMLLRLFDDDVPLINTTQKREGASAANTGKTVDIAPEVTNSHHEQGSNDVTTERDGLESSLID
jgi:multisite-specific tRNA:(cytosine-C5)-methyltransferase